MFRALKRVIRFFSVLVFVSALAMTWWLFDSHDIYPASVLIDHGQPYYRLVVDLRDRGIVNSPWFFSKVGVIIGLDQKLIPGRYDFPSELSNYYIIRKLWKGEVAVMSVTIPEGYNMKQIGHLLSQRCGVDIDIYDSLVRDSAFLVDLGLQATMAEGYLFPETYQFQWGIQAVDAIREMTHQLTTALDRSLIEQGRQMGYDVGDILKMASIIQKEGWDVSEFTMIASVYRNRLQIGMKLQADPTVIYAMGGLDRPLRITDYQFPSSYNTYLHKGLPPTPICSPGMSAIRAALYPEATDYLYFVADGSGRHVFSKTYQEHLKQTRRVNGR